jgi:hypothetical protein
MMDKLIIGEQQVIKTQTVKPQSLPPINIEYKFPSGLWMPTQQLVSEVSNKLIPVIDFINKFKNQKIEITVQAMESQVTNADNEPKSQNFHKKVPPKYLATNRANSVKTIINNFLENALKQNKISIVPTFTQDSILIGSTSYTQGKDNPNDPKYNQEQRIDVIVKTTGESVEVNETCLVGLTFKIDYDKEWEKTDFCRHHQCDMAMFSIYANGVPVKNAKGSNIANLNNLNDGGSRQWIGIFNDEDTKNVLSKSKNGNEIIFTFGCEYGGSDGCHSDAMHVTITDNQNIQIFSDFVSGGKRVKKEDGQQFLIKTDKCGKVLQAAPPPPPHKRTVEKWVYDENDRINSLAKLRATTVGIDYIDTRYLFDQCFDHDDIQYWQLKPWKDVVKEFNISRREQKEIEQRANEVYPEVVISYWDKYGHAK